MAGQSSQALSERPATGALQTEVKTISDDGTFEMYFAAFSNIDRGNDIIQQGAFANLDEFVADGAILLNHVSEEMPVAYPTSAVQDDHGLKVTGRFHSTPQAQAARTILKERMNADKRVLGSIGYSTKDAAFEVRGGQTVRLLKSINVYECSFVNVPMNPRAAAVSVKGLQSLEDARQIVDELKVGRVLSRANHGKLKAWAGTLADHGKAASGLAEELVTWLSQYDEITEESPAKSAGELDVETLRLRALRGRVEARCP